MYKKLLIAYWFQKLKASFDFYAALYKLIDCPSNFNELKQD